jgi:hypothetical protein
MIRRVLADFLPKVARTIYLIPERQPQRNGGGKKRDRWARLWPGVHVGMISGTPDGSEVFDAVG